MGRGGVGKGALWSKRRTGKNRRKQMGEGRGGKGKGKKRLQAEKRDVNENEIGMTWVGVGQETRGPA